MKWSLGKLVLGKPGSFGVFFVFFFLEKKYIFKYTEMEVFMWDQGQEH